jgi:hypothetical protein
VTFVGDDGEVLTGDAASVAFTAIVEEQRRQNEELLRRMKPHERARLANWLGTRTRPQPPAKPTVPPAGRAPRESSNERVRGSRRSRANPARGDPDDAGDPELDPWELPPPPAIHPRQRQLFIAPRIAGRR